MSFFNSLLNFFKTEVYIDLGTANTLVMDRNRGLIANEPSVIAYQIFEGGSRRIVAVGREAKQRIGRTPGNLVASHPLKDGVVAELDATQAMIRYFMHTARAAVRWTRPKLVISLPFGVSDVEKKAVRDCAVAAGAREVALIEEPMAAAIGSELPVGTSRGSMVIDIGGGTTEVAVIALYGIVHCEAVRIGGHAFDQAIVEFIRKKYNLLVGEPSAERLKIEIGSALPGDRETQAPIRGVDFTSGLPREVRVTSHEINEALSGYLTEIIAAAKRTLENTPPELLADIIENGIVLAGGGALLNGIDRRLEAELKVPVRIAEDPLLAIARGGERSIRDPELLARIALV